MQQDHMFDMEHTDFNEEDENEMAELQTFTSSTSTSSSVAGQHPTHTNLSENAPQPPQSKAVRWQDEGNHNNSSSGGGSDRKRNRRSLAVDESAFDDIMGQITLKLTSLSTKDDVYRDSSIAAFMEVLRCPNTEAEFYLESSNWDIQTAVVLWLENNPGRNIMGNGLFFPSTSSALESSSTRSYGSSSAAISALGKPVAKKYLRKDIEMEGINPPWVARVSAYEGVIYFHNLETGQSQRQVPPGFAELPAQKASTDGEDDGNTMGDDSEEAQPGSSSSLSAVSFSSSMHRESSSRSTSPISMEHSSTTSYRDHDPSPALAYAMSMSDQRFVESISMVEAVPASNMAAWKPTPAEERLCSIQHADHTMAEEEEEVDPVDEVYEEDL